MKMKNLLKTIIIYLLLTSCVTKNKYINSLIITSANGNTFEVPKEMDLIYSRNLFFVDLKVNNKNARFLVDTGASTSIIDINQAKKYGFTTKEKNDKITGIGGSTIRYTIYNITTKTKQDQSILIKFNGIDMKNLTTNMEKDGIYIVGVVGSDFLKNANAVIDYSDNRLYLYTKF